MLLCTCLCSIVLLLCFINSHCTLLPEQFVTLHSLYNETNGRNWIYQGFNNVTDGKEWDFTSDEDPCADDWAGIVCNSSHLHCADSACEIRELILEEVGMAGPLPDTLSSLGRSIEVLSLEFNDLTSSLPPSLGDLTKLRLLMVGGNMLTGVVPSSFAQLQLLQVIDIRDNMLSSELPLEVVNAPYSDMEVFYVGGNQFSGSLPSLFNASRIEQIYLTNNLFSGTIPSSFYTFTNLFYLGLATNHICGTLSSDIGNLKSLRNFYAGYNAIESTIPSEIGGLSLLEYFEITRNVLYGTVPKEIGALVNLLVLQLNVNSLTGTLVPELASLSLMHTLYLHDNAFHGTIPSLYSQLKSLQLCILASNLLTGTIPSALSALSNLVDFSVYNNRITGLVPGELFLLSGLEKLLLQNNAMTGFGMENRIAQDFEQEDVSVMYLDISNNDFHGSVPGTIFSKLNNIVSLAATKNCFTGSLPESICEADTLEVLALDGLASGDGCRDKLFYPFSLFDAYLITPLEGDIPNCYWSMPNLTVLHLSGNGLGGSINSDIPEGNLKNISLSFNRLTGSIPRYFMDHHFVELSLSNNKLRGIFDALLVEESGSSVWNRSILDISTNRLSGYVPLHICDVAELSALEGNLFDCDEDHKLPWNDPYKDEYICASDQLSLPLLVCGLILGSLAVCTLHAVAIVYRSTGEDDVGAFALSESEARECLAEEEGAVEGKARVSWSGHLTRYLDSVVVWASLEALETDVLAPHKQQRVTMVSAPNLRVFVSILRMLRKSSMVLSVCLVVVCVPLYYVMKQIFDGFYSTHERQYAWTYSLAYMSGTAPAIFTMTIFCLGCFFVTYSLNVFVRDHRITAVEEEEDKIYGENIQKRREIDCSGGDSNCSKGDGGSRGTTKKKLLKVGCYGVVILSNIVLYLIINTFYIYVLLSSSLDSSMKLLANFAMAIVKLVWNLFVVPTSVEFTARLVGDDYHHLKWIIASLLLFNNIAAPSLATAFTDDKCYEQLLVPSDEIEAFYSMPMCNIYALDVNSGERLCFEYITLSIDTPFTAPFIYNYQCSSSIIVNYVPVFLFAYAFLAMMFPLVFCVLLLPGTYVRLPQRLRDVVPTLLVPPETLRRHPQSPDVPVIRPNRIIATLMSHLAVLLTFGIASPVLGFVIGVTVCTLTFMHQLIIGRYLAFHTGTKEAETYLTHSGMIDGSNFSGGLEHACTNFLSGLPACLWTIIVGSNLLFSFIVFDSVGDKSGFLVAIISSSVAIVVMPILVYLMYRVAMHGRRSHAECPENSGEKSLSRAFSSLEAEYKRPLLE